MSDQSTAIRAGIATSLGSIANLQVSPYLLAQPTPPFAYVTEGEIEYDEAMGGGLDLLEFLIIVGVPFTTDEGSQIAMDALRDPLTGVKHYVDVDDTDGASWCDWCRVMKASKPAPRQIEGGPMVLTCEFTVEVGAPRTL